MSSVASGSVGFSRARPALIRDMLEGMFGARRDPDVASIDLAELTDVLKRAYGTSVAGAVVGRTRLRDEVTHHLGCSLLMGEAIIDTMVARGFLRQEVHPDGWVYWVMNA